MRRDGVRVTLAAVVMAIVLLGAGCGQGQRTPRSQSAVPSSKISSANVTALKTLWQATSTELITHKPLVDKDRVYFADWGGTVYAADAASGSIIWQKTIETVDPKWAWRGFSGTGALGADMLFEASAEGNLFAIDTKNGDVKWKVRFTDKPVSGNTGALLCYNNVVYVPVSSMDEGMDQQKGFVTDFQGRVEAFDATTGKNVWEFKTVTGQANGVAVWSGFALDPETKTLYFTTGNNYTGAATEMSDAIVAVDAMTGELKWVKQCTENDVWTMAQPKNGPDYDFGAAPQLFEAKMDGMERKLVAAGQKSGTLWVLDRVTGAVVWSVQLGAGAAGGGFLAPVSIDGSGIYAWANNAFRYAEADKHAMDVAAFEPATGNVLWKKTQVQPAWMTQAGVVAGDLYFVGSIDGKVRAFKTRTGDVVWTSEPMNSISTSIVSADGRLYFGTGLPRMLGGIGDSGTLYCIGLPK
jgi:polyvinyl alcohol dehydrogenase (cytochrome)